MLIMAEFLRLLDLHGCKIVAEALLSPGAALETHLSTPVVPLEDVPPKTGAMETAEVACKKVIPDREKKKRKTKATAAAKAKVTTMFILIRSRVKDVPVRGRVSQEKKNIFANEENDSDTPSVARLAALQNQTDEKGSPLDLVKGNEESVAGGKKGNGDDDANVIIEGHGDTADGVFGSHTQPSPFNHSGSRVESVRKPMRDKAPLDVETSYSAGRFGNLSFTPQWGLTDSSRIVRSKERRDMMSNIFTPADYEFFNDGGAGWLYNQAVLEAFMPIGVRTSKQSEDDAHQLRLDSERYAVERGNGEMVRHRIINEYLPTFVRRLNQSADYKRSLGEVFSLVVGKGFIDGLSVGRKE
nr:hypothetical protein [Tanacetum cinerariifolium]